VQLAAAIVGNWFLFTGREYDFETGYYYYRSRTYDPGTGTFLQEDPLGSMMV
jgi:RHS repeat-associated protein